MVGWFKVQFLLSHTKILAPNYLLFNYSSKLCGKVHKLTRYRLYTRSEAGYPTNCQPSQFSERGLGIDLTATTMSTSV